MKKIIKNNLFEKDKLILKGIRIIEKNWKLTITFLQSNLLKREIKINTKNMYFHFILSTCTITRK